MPSDRWDGFLEYYATSGYHQVDTGCTELVTCQHCLAGHWDRTIPSTWLLTGANEDSSELAGSET
jgi:hypothetical protein